MPQLAPCSPAALDRLSSMAAPSDLEAPLLRTAVDVKDSSCPADHCPANGESESHDDLSALGGKQES